MARKRRLTGEAALNAAYSKSDHQPLLDAWGITLSEDNLRLALTHRSFAHENDNLPDNERLEFLGDAVLGVSVAEQLYREFPNRSESDLSKMRAGVVNKFALASVARELGIGPYILLGRGEMLTGGDDKDSTLSDTVEAILGAIYLEHGFATARETVLRIFASRSRAVAFVSMMMLSWAYAHGEAGYLAMTEYTSFLYAALLGFLVFGERVSAYTLVGALVIVAACIVAARRQDVAVQSLEQAA